MKSLKPASSINLLLSSFPSDKLHTGRNLLWINPYCFSSTWQQCLAQVRLKVHFCLFVFHLSHLFLSLPHLFPHARWGFTCLSSSAFQMPKKKPCVYVPLIKLHTDYKDNRLTLQGHHWQTVILQISVVLNICCCPLNFIQLLSQEGKFSCVSVDMTICTVAVSGDANLHLF